MLRIGAVSKGKKKRAEISLIACPNKLFAPRSTDTRRLDPQFFEAKIDICVVDIK